MPGTRMLVERRLARQAHWRRERLLRKLRRLQHLLTDRKQVLSRWFLGAICGVVLFGLGFLLFSPILHVREIRVRRTDIRLDAEAIQRSLAPIFGRHLLFLSTQEIASLVRSVAPDLTEMTVRKHYPSRLVLHLTLEPLLAQIAISSPDDEGTALGSGTLAIPYDVLTAQGRFVVYPVLHLPTLPLIRVVDWGVRPEPGQVLLAPIFLERLLKAEEALEQEFGLEVRGRTVFFRAREFHLTTLPLTLWFDLHSPLEDHLRRFRTFLASEAAAEAWQYVDLRLSDRIVYK